MGTRHARRSNYIFEYRITVLGSSCVGKSSLIKRLTKDEFSERHNATIEDHFQHVVDHNGSTCVCLLIDTSGSFEFPAMKKWSISKANAFVVVYSVTDKKSFEIAKLLVDEIKQIKGSGFEIKIMLIGNKMDVEEKRKISKKEGRDFARDISCDEVTCDFVETSAKEDTNVTDALHGLLNMFLPEQSLEDFSPNLSSPEKRTNSFTRSLSRRKKSKSRKQSVVRKELLRRSDENLLDIEKPVHRQRAYSLDTDKEYCGFISSDSDGSPPSPTADSSVPETETESPNLRQCSAKELLRRTTSACKEKIDQAKKKLKGGQKFGKASRQNSVEVYHS